MFCPELHKDIQSIPLNWILSRKGLPAFKRDIHLEFDQYYEKGGKTRFCQHVSEDASELCNLYHLEPPKKQLKLNISIGRLQILSSTFQIALKVTENNSDILSGD